MVCGAGKELGTLNTMNQPTSLRCVLLFPQANVVDVSPGTQYIVTVSAATSSKSSPGVSRIIFTNPSVPGPPQALEGEAVGSNGILLSWMQPDANNIDGYVIR
ncbi:hypothetical protein ATANTOWER_017456 [Ataeniobius toweri]|uniref:Fibronectin type-III domain-containing protein n=1 Tax=Ataeniobius toweri TaxID=208326 RepID=A0ABU7C8Y8_9TELE|nr:hypothetical protein [Ataeniobius toweri]